MSKLFSRVFLIALAAAVVGSSGTAPAQPARRAEISAALNYSAVHAGQDAIVAVVIDIRNGFHAQSHKPKDENLIALVVTPEKSQQATFGEPVYPPGHDQTYPGLGTLNVYSGRTIIYVPLKISGEARPGDLTVSGEIEFQICDDKSCFAPQQVKWKAAAKVVPAGEPAMPAARELFKDYKPASKAPATQTTEPATRATQPAGRSPEPPHAESRAIQWVPFSEELFGQLRQGGGQSRAAGAPPVEAASPKQDWSVPVALGVAFLVGLIFNVMPCVLPVLPLKAIGFYEVAQHHRAKSLMLSMFFSIGIIAVFAVLSVLVVVLKVVGWSQLTANPVFQWTIIGVLVLLSLGMFGLFSVALPSSVYQMTPRHDTITGNVLFGILTALLATPCTAPLLPALIAWAATQPTVVGIGAMLMVGVGMAFPYVVLSAIPEVARNFPRAGPWSELFKQMMGFLLLGSAVFFAAGRLIHGPAFWWAMAPIAAIASLFLVYRSARLAQSARPVVISAALAVLITGSTLYLAAYMSGALASSGGTTLSPLSASARPPTHGKIILVKFTANWCLNCQLVEGTVFRDAQVAAALRQLDVVTMKADLTSQSAPGWPRLRQEEPSGGIPLTAIYVPGYERPVKLDSVYTSSTLIQTLEQISRVRVAER